MFGTLSFSVLKIYLIYSVFVTLRIGRTLSIFIRFSIFKAYYIRIILLNHPQEFQSGQL